MISNFPGYVQKKKLSDLLNSWKFQALLNSWKQKVLRETYSEVRSNEGLVFLSFDSVSKTFIEALESRCFESRWRILSIFLSKIIDVSLITLSARRTDEKQKHQWVGF